MIKTGKTARRYARAIYGLTLDRERTEAVRDDIDRLLALLKHSPDFAQFVGNRQIALERRLSILSLLFEGKADPLTFRFLTFLAQKSRLALLAEIGTAFQEMDDDRRGILKVCVASAQPLTPQQNVALVNRLQARFQKKVQTEVSVDSALLGGLKVYAGDTVYDFSVSSQLQSLKERFINA